MNVTSQELKALPTLFYVRDSLGYSWYSAADLATADKTAESITANGNGKMTVTEEPNPYFRSVK